MAIWDKLREELDDAARVTQDALQKAGRAAQDAIDEGKLRLDAFRARQEADRAAQAYGYALYRARKAGAPLDADTDNRLYNAMAEHESEAARLEAAASVVRNKGDAPPPAQPSTAEPPPAA
ncbi:MAG TPA: hypothetical protein VMM17_06795 [Gemmatimonadaceae bacterium]|nr:hypothetical protein [Gemmatimonadaceae bacterium]